ncbi:MAG: DUF4433 domain-containing protein [Pleurocapsa sp. SU_196_0]|nr:DUF4433 domain-containing protein [Pleurocapsa sp. SU_196_0]
MSAETLLYHFTHIDNLPRILEAGGVLCKRDCGNARNIAHFEVQARRDRVQVPIPPHGNLHDYVPFYFAPRSPMMYSIHKNNVPDVQCDTHELVYLLSSVERVRHSGLKFVFTNGNAAVAFRRQFFNDLERLPEVLDWDLLGADFWNNTLEDQDRKRRRAAEFLVHERVPWNVIGGIGIATNTMKPACWICFTRIQHVRCQRVKSK